MTTCTTPTVNAPAVPTPINFGIYQNMSDDVYHGDRSAISSTTLKECRRSPAHLRAALGGYRFKSSRALILGRAIHSAVLEPHLFPDEWGCAPTEEDLAHCLSSTLSDLQALARDLRDAMVDKIRTNHPEALDGSSAGLAEICKANKTDLKGYSNWKAAERKEKIIALFESRGEPIVFIEDILAASPAAAFDGLSTASAAELKEMIRLVDCDAVFRDEAKEKALAGKTELSTCEMAIIEGIVASVAAHPRASKLLTGGVAETSVFYEHAGTGRAAKVRSDYYREDLGVIADLKTCEDARPEAVMRSIFNFGYHVSAAMYLDGYRSIGKPAEQFVWLFVEKAAPYACRLYVASPALLDRGAEDYHSYMDAYAHGLETGDRPSYPVDIEVIDLPSWSTK